MYLEASASISLSNQTLIHVLLHIVEGRSAHDPARFNWGVLLLRNLHDPHSGRVGTCFLILMASENIILE